MLIPACYFRKIATSHSGLTSSSTGELDVEQYLNGNSKCWVTPEEKKQVRKKLILNQHTFQTLITLSTNTNAANIREQLQEFCETLHKQGFEMYFYKDLTQNFYHKFFQKNFLNEHDLDGADNVDRSLLTKLTFNAHGRLPGEQIQLIIESKSITTSTILARKEFKTADEFVILGPFEVIRLLYANENNQIFFHELFANRNHSFFEPSDELLLTLKDLNLSVVSNSNRFEKINFDRQLIDFRLKRFDMDYEARTQGPLAHLCAEHGPTRKQMMSVREQLKDLRLLQNQDKSIHFKFLQYLSELSESLEQLESPIKFSSGRFSLSELPQLNQLTFFTILIEDLEALIEANQLHLLVEKMPKLGNVSIKNQAPVEKSIKNNIDTNLSIYSITYCYSDDFRIMPHERPNPMLSDQGVIAQNPPHFDSRHHLHVDMNRAVTMARDDFSQIMILYKLKQYLLSFGTPAQRQNLLPQMDKGICESLSVLFFQSEPEQWQTFLEAMYDWQSDEINAHVKNLLIITEEIYVNKASRDVAYLGDGLSTYLDSIHDGQCCVLCNPWHAIAIRKISSGAWQIYDPNHKEGAQTIHCDSNDELIQKIYDTIGKIVTLKKGKPVVLTPDKQIQDVQDFLEHGGLTIIMVRPDLRDYFFEQLRALELSEAALDGFRYQNIQSIPFWLLLIASNLDDKYLIICQKILKNPLLFSKLAESLDHIKTALNLPVIDIDELISNPEKVMVLLAEYNKVIQQKDMEKVSFQLQKSLSEKSAKPPSEKQVIFELIRIKDAKNTLIQIHDSRALEGFSYALQQQAYNLQRPVFVVHSPKDLQCYKSWIHKSPQGRGEIHKGMGGPLHAFLQQNQHKNPLIIIHYEQFEKEDVIRFNAILDEKGNIDGYPIPSGTEILGLQNPLLPSAYLGADFTSRFERQMTPDLNKHELISHIPKIDFSSSAEVSSPVAYLYQNQTTWKKKLLGHWTIQAQGLYYHEGILGNPLPQTLIINNGPWDDPEFVGFWEKAIFQGYIEREGEHLRLPANFRINRQDSYPWQEEKTCIIEPVSSKPFILNPSTYFKFFEHQSINQEQGLDLVRGLIAEHASKVLPIYLTRAISEDLWAQFLAACKSQNVQLSITLAPGVDLPQPIQDSATQIKTLDVKAQVIETNDIDACLAQHVDAHSLVIDVSELSVQQLWSRTTLLSGDEAFNEFLSIDCVLKKELDNPDVKRIILKGKISPVLQDSLAEIFLNHPQHAIVLMVEEADVCQFLPHEINSISLEDKRKSFVDVPQHIDLSERFCKIKSRLAYLNSMGTNNAWQGMDSLEVPKVFKPLALSSSLQEAQAFQQERLTQIQAILTHEPYVFLTGLSGVGKSTFVQHLLSQHASIYYDEQALEAFAKDSAPGQKILFIDEANLKNSDWSVFEGLYQAPPYLLVQGQKYPVNSHKIVFAGNPCNYGDERHVPDFFVRHGNCLVFQPLPAANLYEEVLKPCFKDKEVPIEFCQALIEQYQLLIQFSKDELLVSPRELQMIALLTIAYHLKHPETDITLVGKHFAHAVLYPLVPKDHQTSFLQRFPTPAPLPLMPLDTKDYIITRSRKPITQQLLHYLTLREFRQQSTNPTQQYGGLGGMIIEGEPGVGKSELVINTLVSQGFTQGHIEHFASGKVFYKLPVSMSTKDKETLLFKAFDEGAVVIVDEINSAPMMERLLNELLMGRRPDGNLPKKAGFTLIGTQNPMSMGGRQAQSTALSRRLQTLILPDLTTPEKVMILCHKGLRIGVAYELAKKEMPFREQIRCARHLAQRGRNVSYQSDYSIFNKSAETQVAPHHPHKGC